MDLTDTTAPAGQSETIATPELERVLVEINQERKRQNRMYGRQNLLPFQWLTILGEEYGEVCKAALEAWLDRTKDSTPWEAGYRYELIHVAAVAAAMAECYDRRKRLSEGLPAPKELDPFWKVTKETPNAELHNNQQ